MSKADEPARVPGKLPGEEGLWSFIAADMTLFALLFGSFLNERAAAPTVFAASQRLLVPAFAITNTILLLTSSLFAALAVHAERRENPRQAKTYLALTIGLGLAFCATKAAEYYHEIAAGLTAGSNTFFMFYFVVTGLHLTHVVGGIGGMIYVTFRLNTKSPPESRQYLIESGASFWHMVDLLWLVILPIFYLLP
jgi:nitric oxide reductase NorE protein